MKKRTIRKLVAEVSAEEELWNNEKVTIKARRWSIAYLFADGELCSADSEIDATLKIGKRPAIRLRGVDSLRTIKQLIQRAIDL